MHPTVALIFLSGFAVASPQNAVPPAIIDTLTSIANSVTALPTWEETTVTPSFLLIR